MATGTMPGQLSEFPERGALHPEGGAEADRLLPRLPGRLQRRAHPRRQHHRSAHRCSRSGRPSRPARGARSAAIRRRRSRRSSARPSAARRRSSTGEHEIAPGWSSTRRSVGHTYGSQLLQVNTARGQLVFGSDTYSSWTGIRDWLVANIQQTDTIQQFLAYEKCYVLTSRQNSFNNCIAAHEPTSYTAAYPITSNWWNIPGGNCSRAAELIPGERRADPRAEPSTGRRRASASRRSRPIRSSP